MRQSSFEQPATRTTWPRSTAKVEVPEDGQPDAGSAEVQLVADWIDCFNRGDLDGMLARMSEDVVFLPLRLHGIERTYRGHDGVAHWHERLRRLAFSFEIHLHELKVPAERTVLATGAISLDGLKDGAPFWGVHTVRSGLIAVARHYLSDVELSERFAVP